MKKSWGSGTFIRKGTAAKLKCSLLFSAQVLDQTASFKISSLKLWLLLATFQTVESK